jgi:hypothetical protein
MADQIELIARLYSHRLSEAAGTIVGDLAREFGATPDEVRAAIDIETANALPASLRGSYLGWSEESR